MTAAWRTALDVLGSDEAAEEEEEATDASERDGACRHAGNSR